MRKKIQCLFSQALEREIQSLSEYENTLIKEIREYMSIKGVRTKIDSKKNLHLPLNSMMTLQRNGKFIQALEIKKAFEEVDHNLREIRGRRENLIKIKESITNDGFVSYITDIGAVYFEFQRLQASLNFTIEEQIAIIGMIIKNDARCIRENPELVVTLKKEYGHFAVRVAESCQNLDDFFNDDGTLVPWKQPQILVHELGVIFGCSLISDKKARDFMKEYKILSPIKFIEKTSHLLVETTKNTIEQEKNAEIEEIKKQEEEERKAAYDLETEERIKGYKKAYKNQRQEDKIKKDAVQKLSQYYIDGEFIEIPESTDEFIDILKTLGYSEEKIKLIIEKMNIFIEKKKEEELYKKYITTEEYELLVTASKHSDNKTISYLNNEIRAAIQLQEESESNDLEDMKLYINECINKIREALEIITKKYE